MEVYRSLEGLPPIPNAIVTQGTFDGVHKAHRLIINRLKEIATRKNGTSVVVTFEPHPRMVLHPHDHALKLLSTLDEKIEYLKEEGIDYLIIIPFSIEFSRLDSMQFIRKILVEKIRARTLVIGYDHRFGKNREGSFEHLREFGPLYGFEVEEIPEQDVDNVAVSSTKIRTALLEGDVQKAHRYLDRHYSIEGTVVKGKQLGRLLGYPTANLDVNSTLKLIPQDGVYAVKVQVNGAWFGGMMNIGNNPTIENKGRSIEVHIFNFNQDIYNKNIRISFVDKIRPELKFENLDALKSQLATDKVSALTLLGQN